MDQSTKPTRHLISVIIPCYNAARYLAEAIESVLAQTYRPIEVIVIDDGSDDGSAVIAKKYADVKCIEQAHAGVCTALNSGIQRANGELLAFLDADDLWMPGKLTEQKAFLERNSIYNMVFGHVQEFFSPELAEDKRPSAVGRPEITPGYLKNTVLIWRRDWLRVGLFNTKLSLGDFIDWYERAKDLGLASAMLPQVVCKRRLHDQNSSLRKLDSRIDYLRIIKESLDRRRAEAKRGS